MSGREVEIRRVPLVSACLRDELYELHSSFYDNLLYNNFVADFAAKDWVILIRDGSRTVGFSTIIVHEVGSVPGRFLFSGDTIVHPCFWRANLLLPAFAAFLRRTLQECGTVPLYWHLLSKGFRTYLFLPTFFRTYHPDKDGLYAALYRGILDAVCVEMFGTHYDRATGIVSFGGQRDYLGVELSRVPELRRTSPHIKFFLAANPLHRRGDELACITRVCPDNMKPLALRMVEGALATWVE
jgi:hypothetical protein